MSYPNEAEKEAEIIATKQLRKISMRRSSG
jgi:hypothetical protein